MSVAAKNPIIPIARDTKRRLSIGGYFTLEFPLYNDSLFFEISHNFYNDYGWTNLIFQKDENILIFQDYRSLSINRRTLILNSQIYLLGFKIFSDNIFSLQSSENSIGLTKKFGKFELGGDLRIIRGGVLRNNSGIFLRSEFMSFEIRPLLKMARFLPRFSLLRFNHKIDIIPNFESFSYSLPQRSEMGYRAGIRPLISFGEKLGYTILFNLSTSNYPTSPTKDKKERGVRFDGFASLELPLFFHHFNFSRSLNSTFFPTLKTTRWEDDISFSYSPKSKYFSLRLGIRRYLNIYDGVMEYQSSALREISSLGEISLEKFRAYLGKRSEEYAYLSPLMSSESRRTIKYFLGFENFKEKLIFRGEIVALYTLYRFKFAENALNRYLEVEAKYKSKVECDIRFRFSDFGWFFHETYYRVGRRTDIYSSGWVPLASFLNSYIGAIFSIKPEGSGVGLGGKFRGGEIFAIKRLENGRKFWEFSLSYSTSL